MSGSPRGPRPTSRWWTSRTGTGSGSGAIAERFAQANSIDTFAVAKKFYATHPDSYDQILMWTDQPLIRDAFAYELNIKNEVRGIGQDIFDRRAPTGSGGRLRSLVVMDWLGKYPEDPATKFLGENNTLSVLGQEVGHRWRAYLGSGIIPAAVDACSGGTTRTGASSSIPTPR